MYLASLVGRNVRRDGHVVVPNGVDLQLTIVNGPGNARASDVYKVRVSGRHVQPLRWSSRPHSQQQAAAKVDVHAWAYLLDGKEVASDVYGPAFLALARSARVFGEGHRPLGGRVFEHGRWAYVARVCE